jgi:formylmethanofuran dehydrogenase subunit E
MDSTNYTEDFKNSIQLHGHACIGLAVGYVAAMTAMERLGLQRAQDEELIAIAECDACGVDAIQAVLGCTLGKGNLIYRDHGKNVFTVIDRRKNDAMRIALNVDLFARTDEQQTLMEKVISGQADETERESFWRAQEGKIDAFLAAPPEQSFSITRVKPEAPGHARLFTSLLCEVCGEQVMEPRVRLREGKKVCIPCSENYGRGW